MADGKGNMGERFPRESWVSKKMGILINKKLNEYATENNIINNILYAGIKNSSALCQSYSDDYYLIYRFRAHNDVLMKIKNIQIMEHIDNHVRHHNVNQCWNDETFISTLVDYIISGRVQIEGFSFVGELTDDLIRPLLNLTPPMQQEIRNSLHEALSYLLAVRIYIIYRQCADEVLLSARSELQQLLEEKIKSYTLAYDARDDETSIHHLYSDIPDYYLWYTTKGTPVNIKNLLRGIEDKLDAILNKYILLISGGEGGVSIEELTIAESKYNDLISAVRFYWEAVDFPSLMDKIILEEIKKIGMLTYQGVPELTPEQMTLKGTMTVKAEYKFLKDFTMREIALGIPGKESTLINSLSFDYEGVIKKYHSNKFESMIRKLPDVIEFRLNEKANEIEKNEAVKVRLKKYYKLSFMMIINDFLLKDPAVAVSQMKGFNPSLKDDMYHPQLINIRGREISHVITVPIGSQKNTGVFLLVSFLTGECKVINNTVEGWWKEGDLRPWIFKHLSVYDRHDEFIEKSFDDFKYVIISNMVVPVRNDCPLTFIEKEDYTEELCNRYAHKIRSDTASLISNTAEKARDYFIEFISLTASTLCLGPAKSLLGLITQFVMGTVVISVTEILQFYYSDHDRDVKAFWAILVSLLTGLVVNARIVVTTLRSCMYSQVKQQLSLRGSQGIRSLQNGDLMKYYTSEGYRKPANLLAKGSNSCVYRLDEYFIMKDYNKLLTSADAFSLNAQGVLTLPIYNNSLIEANNNAVAMNRLYGKGAASVIIFKRNDAYVKSVSIRMKKIPGETLADILHNQNTELKTKLRMKLSASALDDIVEDTLKALKEKGIAHHDINLANIIYDSNTETFRLVDFDSAVINPIQGVSAQQLTHDKYALMISKLTADFREFSRLCAG